MEKANGGYFKLNPEQYAAAVAHIRAAKLPVEFGTHRGLEPNLHMIPTGTWTAAQVAAFEAAVNSAK